MEGKGMPADFAATFDAAKTDFNTCLEAYNNSKMTVMQETAAKTEAFNEVYATLSSMLKDGKSIFGDNKAVQDLFVFAALQKMAGKTSRTGIRLELLDSETRLPVTTTRFVIEPGDEIGFPNSKGIAEISLPSGKYSIVATTPGYTTLTLTDIVVKKDTMRHISMLLQKAVAVA